MSMAAFRPRRKVALATGCVLALVAWLLPSQFSAERYRQRLEGGLEAVLHRPASFGSASFQLLPQPRFTLENVIIHETPAFGPEPFVRIDRVECDLRWSSIWHRKMEFARLSLSRPSVNIVRNAQREWNFETFLIQTGVTGASPSAAGAGTLLPFAIEVEDARLDFKEGYAKKPFAMVDLQGRLEFSPAEKRIRFNLKGNPQRTDLAFPPPGLLEFSGEWSPGADLRGTFDASLRTQGAMIYNWVPLLTGTNYEIYGVMDADVRLRGTLRAVTFEGQSSITQLHRWEMLPPSDAMPVRLRYRAAYDMTRGRLAIESTEVLFADSSIHLTGTVDKVLEAPDFDLVVAFEHSQLEDWSRLARRLWRIPDNLTLAGRLDGLLTVQGRHGERRYGGFMAGRGARLVTSAGAFPISDIALRLDPNGARMDPAILTIAPRCAIAVEGAVYPAKAPGRQGKGAQPPRYEIRADTKSADLREVVRFARALGIPHVRTTDAQGLGNAAVLLKGTAWPLAKPTILVKADIRSARLLIPGLTEPLNIPHARFQVTDQRMVIDSLTAVIGSSVFTGRVQHSGGRAHPWEFDLKANSLSVEQGAAWFDALGHRPALALLERIPGLKSLNNRRTVASGLFTAINARGRFSTPLLTYRSLRLQEFEASLNLADRILGLSGVSFRAGKGRGEARAQVNLNISPAEIAGELKVAEVKLETITDRLPPALRKMRGTLSGTAQFKTRGLSRSEMSENLVSEGTARLDKVGFGEFDPLGAILRRAVEREIDRPHREALLKSAEIAFGVQNRQVIVANQQIDIEGAKLRLNGSWTFNGPLDLDVTADLRGVKRPWLASGMRSANAPAAATIHLTGVLGQIQAARSEPASLASRSTVQ